MNQRSVITKFYESSFKDQRLIIAQYYKS